MTLAHRTNLLTYSLTTDINECDAVDSVRDAEQKARIADSVCDVGFDVIRLGVTPSTSMSRPISVVSLKLGLLAAPADRKDDLPASRSFSARRSRARSAHRLIVMYVDNETGAHFGPYDTFNIK